MRAVYSLVKQNVSNSLGLHKNIFNQARPD